MPTVPRFRSVPILLLLGLLLGACAPGVSPIRPPSFDVTEGLTLTRLEAPHAAEPTGAAIFRIGVLATNPNPFGVSVAGLDFDLALSNRRVATSAFTDGFVLAANGSSRLELEIRVPFDAAAQVAVDLAALFGGRSVPYALGGTVTVETLGVRQRLPRVQLVAGELRQPLSLVAPNVRFVAAQSGLRELTPFRAAFDVTLELDNPGFVGYVVRTPAVLLDLGGVRIGASDGVDAYLPPFSSRSVTLRFETSPAALGAGIAAQLANLGAGGSRGVDVEIVGGFTLEVPGVTALSLQPGRLTGGVLR